MQQFVEKMVKERDELNAKIKKLGAAANNPPFGVNEEKLDLIKRQLTAMNQYLDCLNKRLFIEGVR